MMRPRPVWAIDGPRYFAADVVALVNDRIGQIRGQSHAGPLAFLLVPDRLDLASRGSSHPLARA